MDENGKVLSSIIMIHDFVNNFFLNFAPHRLLRQLKKKRKNVTIPLLFLAVTGFLLFRNYRNFRIPVLKQSLRLIKDNSIVEALVRRLYTFRQDTSLVRAFAGEDSPANDVPEMAYMRKVGRLTGLPHNWTQLEAMTLKELVYIYHSYLDNIDYLCDRKLRMGQVGYGGWEICDDYAYRPIKPCIVYSFGVQQNFVFEDEISNLYACDVYAFDSRQGKDSYNRSPTVHFYSIDHKVYSYPRKSWSKSFGEIKSLLRHQNKTIDVLKMDMLSGEWRVLPEILNTGELVTVRQLLVEFHTRLNDSAIMYRRRLKILAGIEALGFRRFHTHMVTSPKPPLSDQFPVARSPAYEVYFVNTKMARAPR